jgi:hypothetical protein
MPPTDPHPPLALGAYGIRLDGLDAAANLLVPVGGGAPRLRIDTEIGRAPAGAVESVGDDAARIRLRSGGEILIDRDAGHARYRVPHPVRPDELVHPYLAPAAAVVARWEDRESFHAGAIAGARGAWGVIGVREAGKSSTLAYLAQQGADILCDDMLVVDAGAALPGPRSVDLREDAARRLGAGQAIGLTGARERWRITLGPVRDGLELRGWIFLAWGDALAARRLSGAERLQRLFTQLGLRLPPRRPERVMELAGLPAYELARPADWSSLPGAADRLRELADG